MLNELSPIIVLIVIFAIAFDFINGFHDTANSIATVVSTRVMAPRDAILMATILEFFGALAATGVAKTVAAGILSSSEINQIVILAAVIGAIVWNLTTWYF